MRLVDRGPARLQAAGEAGLAQHLGPITAVDAAFLATGPAAAFGPGHRSDRHWQIGDGTCGLAHSGALQGLRVAALQRRRQPDGQGFSEASRSICRCISSTRAFSSDKESCCRGGADDAGAAAGAAVVASSPEAAAMSSGRA